MKELVTEAKADLQIEMDSMKQANHDLIAESEQQAETLMEQEKQLATYQARNAELQGKLEQMRIALETAHQDIAAERMAAEQARTKLARAHLKLEVVPRIETELHQLRSELDQEKQAHTATTQQAAILHAKYEAEIAMRQRTETLLNTTLKRVGINAEIK